MRLIKEAYFGLHGKDEYRFYFEHDDIGLFVWMDRDGQLVAFQADFKNRISFHFSRPNLVGIRGINNEPISGGITGIVGQAETDQLKSNILSIETDAYVGMIDMIKRIVRGEDVHDYQIPEPEVKRLKALPTKVYKYPESS